MNDEEQIFQASTPAAPGGVGETPVVLVGAAALVVVSCAAGIATPSVRAITRATPVPTGAKRDPSVG